MGFLCPKCRIWHLELLSLKLLDDIDERTATFDSEADSPCSKFEISSFFPKVEKEMQVFWDTCLRQSFALVFY